MINTASNAVSTVTLPSNSVPAGIAVSPDGTKVYTTTGTGTVSVINIASNAVSTVTLPVNSGPIGIAVGPPINVAANTTTALGSSPATSAVYGNNVVLTAAIAGGGGYTGTVAFSAGGIAISGCTAQPLSNGTATCTLSNMSVGNYSYSAAFSGDSNNNPSTLGGAQL